MSAATAPRQAMAPAPERLPRLLAEAPGRWVSVAEYRQRAGPCPAVGRHPRLDLLEAIRQSGLRGKGGGAFPTGQKMRAVVDGPGRPVVVVNGAEGEPASRKDKLVLSRAPHLVIDGALVAAAAVGAREVIICIDRHAQGPLASVRRAIDERMAFEGAPVPVRLTAVPSHYVSGDESALVRWLSGGPAKPTVVPPRPFERGVGGRPTLIDNVETLAHVAQIARWGPAWFRTAGTREEPGSTLLTISGAVARPGVYEVPLGASLGRVLERVGAVAADLSAILVGGYFGTWLTVEQAGATRVSCADLARVGGGLGCGVIVALPRTACGVSEAARVMGWLAASTAGQCGSCVNGLASLADATAAAARGSAPRDVARRLLRWADQVEGRGACRLPDGAARFVRSSLATFQHDLDRHLRGGRCGGAEQPSVLPVPPVSGDAWQ
jgi:NADH:ubiquinone oxidoreductase subunit F (NADH-binding)